MTQSYAIKGKKIASEPYHYTQCGLDDVYLMNGYTRQETPYGGGFTVERAEQLQHAIAENLCLNKAFLNGKEFRFLRKLMDLTQAEIAVNFGCEVQAVARWEKGKSDINGAADRLIRVIYLGCREAGVQPADLIKRISGLDVKQDVEQVFEETESGWKTAA